MENTEEKKIEVQLIKVGGKKLPLLKLIKEASGLGLKDSKTAMDTMTSFEVPETKLDKFSKAVRYLDSEIVVCADHG